jgi:hypothetical protein
VRSYFQLNHRNTNIDGSMFFQHVCSHLHDYWLS